MTAVTLDWAAVRSPEHHFAGDAEYGLPSKGRKVIFCIPTVSKPHAATLASLEREVPLLHAAGWEEGAVYMIGCPYISAARAAMLRKALDAKADVIVFIDHDVSWRKGDLLKLIETDAPVAAGVYRFKREPVEFMGMMLPDPQGYPQVREDGCIRAHCVPAGFLKVTRQAVNAFARAYPELLYGEAATPHVDLFNHGAHEGVWFGEDYAFSRNWIAKCGEIWVVPDLTLTHHTGEVGFVGNYHEYLQKPLEERDCAFSTQAAA